MAGEMDRLIETLDEEFEDKRELTQHKANTAADALVRQKAREAALSGDEGHEAGLREKYQMEAK